MPANPLERIAVLQRLTGDIIQDIEILQVDNPEHLKLRVSFVNGDALHIREAWVGESLHRYAYYWLDSKDALQIGWENVPHHDHIDTYPHHKHVGEQANIQPTQETNLESVLEVIHASIKLR